MDSKFGGATVLQKQFWQTLKIKVDTYDADWLLALKS